MSSAAVMKTVSPIRQDPFSILKSDNLVIGGYASIEMVDKQNDLITLEALKEAVSKYMQITKFRNVMTNHSNVQVGEVIPKYRDKSGRLWKTDVDDVGFFVVIKMREDIEKAKEVGREIRDGSLRSFSIGGQALEKKKKTHKEYGEYNEISKLELHEVTICEKGINPEARFDVLKMEKGSEKMSEIEKALKELNNLLDTNKIVKEWTFMELMSQKDDRGKRIHDNEQIREAAYEDINNVIGTISLGGTPLKRLTESMEGKPVMNMSELQSAIDEHNEGSDSDDFEDDFENSDTLKTKTNKTTEKNIKNIEKNDKTSSGGNEMTDVEKEEYMETEEEEEPIEEEPIIENQDENLEDVDKSKPDLPTGQVEAGNAGDLVSDSHDQLDSKYMAKYADQSTLDLSPENLEKAYIEFKAEQLEKLAYDKVKDGFQSRFDTEMVTKTEEIEKLNYDAKAEVTQLKKQFTDLLTSLKDEHVNEIKKQEEVIAELDIPSGEEISKMDWSDINALVERLEGQI